MAAGLELVHNATEPTQPAAGFSRVFIDTDGDMACKRPDGSVSKLKGGGAVNLAGYDLTLGADSTVAGSLTGGGEVQVPTGAVAQLLRSGVGMLRGSNVAANRLPFFASNTDVLDGDAGMTYDAAADRLTVGGGLVAPSMRPATDSTTAVQLQKANGTAVLTLDTTNSKVDVAALKIGGVDVPFASGSFTPSLTFGGASTGITYSGRVGSYIRLGNLCFVNIYIGLSNKGSASGEPRITGLPYTISVSSFFPVRWTALNTAFVLCLGFAVGATSEIGFRTIAAANVSLGGVPTNADFTNTTELYIGGTYLI